jgi:hypothetical protein
MRKRIIYWENNKFTGKNNKFTGKNNKFTGKK